MGLGPGSPLFLENTNNRPTTRITTMAATTQVSQEEVSEAGSTTSTRTDSVEDTPCSESLRTRVM